MSALLLLIAVSLAMSAGFVWLCILSIRGGQFDDLESPRWRIFFSDAVDPIPMNPGLRTEPPARIAQHDPD